MSAHQPLHIQDLVRVARIVAGDEDALNEFYGECSRRSEILARRARIPWQDRQDIAQNVILAALDQLQRGSYRAESKLETWLERIIQRKIADYFRKQRSGTVEGLDESDRSSLEIATTETSLTLSKKCDTLEIGKIEARVMVEEALLRLPVLYRAILVLNRIEGYTPKEISEMSNMPVRQVRNRLYTAQDKFRRIYLDERSPPVEKTIREPLLPPDAEHEGVTYARSTSYRLLAILLCSGAQSEDHGLLLRACRRIGQAFERIGEAVAGSSSRRMRVLPSGGRAVESGNARYRY
jgi:RNA polymerase sigma-70 factor (ECF subfamily)